MAVVEVTPKVVFSLRQQVRQNAHFISDFQILYPAGSVLVMHNYIEKRQRHIKLFDKSIYVELIIISPSRKYAAIIQNSDRGQIIIFDMQTLKRRRVLHLPHDSNTNRFETITFSHDDSYVMALSGEPDWNMITYNWTKGKVLNLTKATYPGTSTTVEQICCSPVSNGEVCLIGRGLFRLLSLNETVWKQYGFQKVDQTHVTTAVWLSGSAIICGTSEGKLIVVVNGEPKGVYDALNTPVINWIEKDEYTQALGSSSVLAIKSEPLSDDIVVRTLIAFPKGFAYSCGIGHVHFYELDKNKYRKRNVYVIDDPIVEEIHSPYINVVNHLSINVSQDKLLATTNRAQIYVARLWGPDLHVAPKIPFRHLGEPLHNGSINGLALCVWKPIFATSGKNDRTVQIWNFETETVEIVKHFNESIQCIDLHPMGTFIAIGFVDRLQICLILMNDIQPGRSFPVRNCHNCNFGYHGNVIAAVSENTIEVFNFVMYQSVCILKGHTGNVTDMIWTTNGKGLLSCGSDGRVILWDTVKGGIVHSIESPGVVYLGVALSSDAKFVYVVGDDGLIKEIVDGNIVKEVSLNHDIINNITLSRSNHVMFLSTGTCDMIAIKLPLTNPPDYSVYPYHSTEITQIKITFDDLSLITVSAGGSIIVWKLNVTEDKAAVVDKNFVYSNEVLIKKSQLEEHIVTMRNLSQKLYEMEMGQAREMRDTENSFQENIKDLHEKYQTMIKDLQTKVQDTEAAQRKQLINSRREIDELVQMQEKEKETMIENYTAKLEVEREKVRGLEEIMTDTVKTFDEMVEELTRTKEEETNEIIRIYEQKLLDVNNALREAHEENLKNIDEHEMSKQYLEEDADRELVETKAKYETVLREEKEMNVTYKDEAVNMRKKFAEAHKARIEFRGKLESLESEQQKLQGNVQSLEKDIADLKNEIIDRDAALKEKDERIYRLKKTIQELEKYKFVLDYKIKELKNQIDPKDREIREKNEELVDMEEELENLKKVNQSLELQVSELKEKIRGTEKESNDLDGLYQESNAMLKQIKIDIYSLYQEMGNFKSLKDGIMSLYHKYHKMDASMTNKYPYGDTDAQKDFLIQREFLEKTILALKSTLHKNQKNKTDRRKVVQDNEVLLEELNSIRRDLKVAITAVARLERLIGKKQRDSVAPSEAYSRMQQALQVQDKIKKVYQDVIDVADMDTAQMSANAKTLEERLQTLLQMEQAEPH